MALDFPSSPTPGQIYPLTAGVQQWIWDGTKWVAYNTGGGGGGAPLIVSDTAPSAPTIGSLWFDSVGGQMYVWESDGNSSQWVPVVNQGGALTIAAATNVGRNLIHNSMFNIAQRGAGPWTANVSFTADRWVTVLGTDADSFSLAALVDADRSAIGDEAAQTTLQNVFTGNAAAGAYSIMRQNMENVRRLGGKTVTVSFWAKAATGNPKLGVSIDQNFGTGGSPSASVLGNGQAVTLSTAWARYSATLVLGSTAGMTLGTNGDHVTQLNLWYSAGSNFNARSGNVGVQSGTIQLWGVQLEIGSVATPLEKPDLRYDLANCQRFYQGNNSLNIYGYQAAGQLYQGTAYIQPMRAAPTIAITNNTSQNMGALTTSMAGTTTAVVIWGNASATGSVQIAVTFTASADL